MGLKSSGLSLLFARHMYQLTDSLFYVVSRIVLFLLVRLRGPVHTAGNGNLNPGLSGFKASALNNQAASFYMCVCMLHTDIVRIDLAGHEPDM